MNCLELEYALEADIMAGLEERFGAQGLEAVARGWALVYGLAPMKRFEKIASLDILLGLDLVPSLDDAPEVQAISQDLVAEYRASLTPRQRYILDELVAGYTQPEIAAKLGHKDTQIVRYQKHLAKAKWKALAGS